jgi:hypothetical protein
VSSQYRRGYHGKTLRLQLRNVSFKLRNVSLELRNVSLELRNVSVYLQVGAELARCRLTLVDNVVVVGVVLEGAVGIANPLQSPSNPQ